MSQDDDLFALWAERARGAQPTPDPEPAQVQSTAAATTREQRRSRRKREVRAHTIRLREMEPDARRAEEREYHPDASIDVPRPQTRAECVEGERPCPWAGCQHHLFLDVLRSGSIKLNFPDLEVWELSESCALDVADRTNGEGISLEQIGTLLNLTRERVRQLEKRGLAKLRRLRDDGLAEHAEDEGFGRSVRRLPVITDGPEEDEEDDD